MITDELRCPICGAEATENAKGRLEITHSRARHESTTTAVAVTPLRRPVRTGAWGEHDDE